MTFARLLATVVALSGCAAPVAGTQGHADRAADSQDAAVRQAVRGMLAAGDCRDARAEIADPPVSLEEARFRGASKQTVRVEGCGRRSLLNILVVPAPGGGGQVVRLLPGTTIADPLLQRRALDAAKAAAPGCDSTLVIDTRFDGPAGLASRNGRVAQPWSETWLLGACGRLVAVPLDFTPEEGGTTVSVRGAPPRR